MSRLISSNDSNFLVELCCVKILKATLTRDMDEINWMNLTKTMKRDSGTPNTISESTASECNVLDRYLNSSSTKYRYLMSSIRAWSLSRTRKVVLRVIQSEFRVFHVVRRYFQLKLILINFSRSSRAKVRTIIILFVRWTLTAMISLKIMLHEKRKVRV